MNNFSTRITILTAPDTQYATVVDQTNVDSSDYATVDTKPSLEEPTYTAMGEDAENVYTCFNTSDNFDPLIPNVIPISVSDLGTHVANCHLDNNNGFQDQYKVKCSTCSTTVFLVFIVLHILGSSIGFNTGITNFIRITTCAVYYDICTMLCSIAIL